MVYSVMVSVLSSNGLVSIIIPCVAGSAFVIVFGGMALFLAPWAARNFHLARMLRHETLLMSLLFLTVVLLATLATLCRLSPLLGCYLAGLLYSPIEKAEAVYKYQFKRYVTLGVLLFFSCTVAFVIPIREMFTISAFGPGIALAGAGW